MHTSCLVYTHLTMPISVQNADVLFAHEVCEELMASSHGAAWDVCVDLSEHPDFHNVKAR